MGIKIFILVTRLLRQDGIIKNKGLEKMLEIVTEEIKWI